MEGRPPPELATLRLVYADVIRERDRLRNARASFASRLLPLPVLTAVAAAGFSQAESPPSRWLLGLGFVPLLLAVIVWVLLGSLPPYRVLRQDEVALRARGAAAEEPRLVAAFGESLSGFLRPQRRAHGEAIPPPSDKVREANWLREAIEVERAIARRMTVYLELERLGFVALQVLAVTLAAVLAVALLAA